MAERIKFVPNLPTILKIACWVFACALLFLPSLFFGGVQPEVKWFFQFLACLFIVLTLLRFIFDPQKTWTFTKFEAPALMYIIVVIIAMIGSIYPPTSLLSFFSYIAPLLFYIGMVQLIHRRRWARRMVIAFILYGSGLSLFGIFQGLDLFPHSWWWTGGDIAATYVNKNHFGGFLEMAIFLSLGQVFYGNRTGEKIVFFFLTLLMMVTLFLTHSSGALISLFCALILFLFFVTHPKKVPRFSLVISFFLCLFMVLFIFNRLATITQQGETKQNSVLSDELNSWGARESIWKSTALMIKDHPLTGVGPGNFELAYPSYRQARMDKRIDYAHNDFLQFVAEVGVFGIVFLFFATYRLFRQTFVRLDEPEHPRFYRGIVVGAFCGLISIWFHSLLDFNLQIPANALIVAFLVALINLQFYSHTKV